MTAPNITSLDYVDSVPLQELLRHIIPLVPELPQAFALDLLRQKYTEFARKTRILCCEIVNDYQSDVTDYYLDAPTDYEIYSIIGIEGGQYGYYWYGESRVQFKHNFDVIDNNCIQLAYPPSVDEVGGLKVYVTLLPTPTITTMPRSISTPFGQMIGRGVVADALYIPNKSWTNPELARKYQLDYERMLLSARALSVSNRKVDSNSIKPVRIL